MTWQLGAAAVLILAVAAGLHWYERTRPDARIIALVGTLAGFGALGRIAFAAVPNVKPTTDIVLVAGYALGGGPGFAVGALAALTSNFFFGQGPWTPWQMAAWGATGVLGAGLAVLSRRRIGRLGLAIVCGVCGFAFTVVQDVGDWVTYSDHSLTQLGLYVGRGLGFDAVHAIGCVGFALAFGPALIRSLQRFARRLSVTWIPLEAPGAGAGVPLAAILVVVAAGSLVPSAGVAHAATVAPQTRAISYLRGAQNTDGGFGADRGQTSASLFTGWAALGLAATGRSPLAPGPGGVSAIAYVRSHPPGGDVGGLERTILVLGAAGLSPRDFGGRDLVAALLARRRPDGSTAGQVNLTAFAVLALRSARMAPSARTAGWLGHAQNRDGGFGFAPGASSDPDDTGAVLEALAGVPGAAAWRARAVAYLRRAQDPDGGFAASPGAGSNAQSTAWAIQGLLGAGVSPSSLHHGGPSALAYLQSLVSASGAVRYARGQSQTPVWVTGEALMALAGRPLPIPAVPAPAPAAAPASAPAQAASGRATARRAHRAAARRRSLPPRRRGRAGHRAARAGRARLRPGVVSGRAAAAAVTAVADGSATGLLAALHWT
ncbi:MAG TPA: prenyltransferase/squalene oxidase repeat-containing protein [Solirubrobacteraceae bacterium]|nr:prenyltransferase/squalene oxidase repeat-containing protein [Solirubrobacteraceae bacterium]